MKVPTKNVPAKMRRLIKQGSVHRLQVGTVSSGLSWLKGLHWRLTKAGRFGFKLYGEPDSNNRHFWMHEDGLYEWREGNPWLWLYPLDTHRDLIARIWEHILFTDIVSVETDQASYSTNGAC